MPLHVLPSRRQFLATSLAAGAALSLPRMAGADNAQASATFALLADTHIAADRQAILREVKMAEHLAKVWEEVRAAKPAGALLHGDVALLKGEAGDYQTLADLLIPTGNEELPLHFLLGNHDDRDQFRGVLKDEAVSPIESKLVAVVEAGPANWFLLDSLDKPNVTPGLLGAEQLKWLAAALDEHADKPALVSVHHHPVWPKNDPNFKNGGITDTVPLFEILEPRQHVKAVFFGHTHDWAITSREGIHLVNLPPVAYVFAKGRPSGWVSATIAEKGITLTLSALDKTHQQHGEKHELAWR
jgi:3',5'-cyclic AMP phosphodiesterase CpdA